MPKCVYLDTNAFRYFGEAFAKATLADDLKDKILISPLSASEVFAQLADEKDGEQVLTYVHAIPNWTNSKNSGLLPWPDEWLYELWFQAPYGDSEFITKMQDAFNMCLAANSVSEFKQTALEHCKLMDDFKEQKGREFKAMIDTARQQKAKTFDITEVWFNSIAKSVGADPASKSKADVVTLFSAHHEFEQTKLDRALDIAEYNPLSRTNQNDIIDAEQLLYLADTSLGMLTSDGGFKSKITKSSQATRIFTLPPAELMDATRAETALRNILG